MLVAGISDHHHRMDDAIQRVKSSLTLDFSNMKRSSAVSFDDILTSPDLGLLKLTTPDLDRFILQHHQERKPFETPTSTLSSFPNSVTEEQEAYARGFVDALLDLQCKQEAVVAAGGLAMAFKSYDLSKNSPCDQTFNPMHQSNCVNLNVPRTKFYPADDPMNGQSSTAAIYREDNNYNSSCSFAREQHKTPFTERQAYATTKPVKFSADCYNSPPMAEPSSQPVKRRAPASMIGFVGVDTPPISPIDMVQQEAIKLHRKRARNRLAATRCRNRKLERIANLQTRVNELRGVNSNLARTAASLRQIVGQMRQEVMEHASRGCRLLTHHSVLL